MQHGQDEGRSGRPNFPDARYSPEMFGRMRRSNGLLERFLWLIRQGPAVERLINRWRPLLLLEASFLAIVRPDIQQLSAGAAYYGIMTLVPILVAGMNVIALALGEDTARVWFTQLSALVLPTEIDVIALLGDPSAGEAGTVSGFAFLGLAWGLYKLFGAVSAIPNIIWGIEPFNAGFAAKLREATVISAAALVFVVSSVLTLLVADDLAARVLRALRLPEWADVLASNSVAAGVNFLAWLLLVLALLIIYRYVPERPVRWRWAALAGLAVGVVLHLMNYAFAMFMAHVAPSHFVYGVLASALVILFWLFLAARLFAWGAALSAYAQSLYDSDGPLPGSFFR